MFEGFFGILSRSYKESSGLFIEGFLGYYEGSELSNYLMFLQPYETAY